MGSRWSPPIWIPPRKDLVARDASRWGIEQAFAAARQIIGVGEARNRTRRAVERTVPFGLICFSMVTAWYALHGHAPEDVAGHRARARRNTTKTEPSYDDMTVKLRRVITRRPLGLDNLRCRRRRRLQRPNQTHRLAHHRHHRQLSGALRHAGYTGPLARHLIRTSPLLALKIRSRGAGSRLLRDAVSWSTRVTSRGCHGLARPG